MGRYSKYTTGIIIGLCFAVGLWGFPYIIVNSMLLIFDIVILSGGVIDIMALALMVVGFILGFIAVITTSETASY
jgi:hypothetical protein